MDFEGSILVTIIEGIINIKKQSINVPIFRKKTDEKSMLTGTSET